MVVENRRLLKELHLLSVCLGTKPLKLTVSGDDIIHNDTLSGYATIAMKISQDDNAVITDFGAELQALTWQWLEARCQVCDTITVHQLLDMMTFALAQNTYLCGNVLSVADILLYFAVHSEVSNLTCQDLCTKFSNIARWFSHIQTLTTVQNDFKALCIPKCKIYI